MLERCLKKYPDVKNENHTLRASANESGSRVKATVANVVRLQSLTERPLTYRYHTKTDSIRARFDKEICSACLRQEHCGVRFRKKAVIVQISKNRCGVLSILTNG